MKFSYNDSWGNWIEWMNPKIAAAYSYLREDGAIFISIDDNRLIELAVLCNKIFGAGNRLAIMITRRKDLMPKISMQFMNMQSYMRKQEAAAGNERR